MLDNQENNRWRVFFASRPVLGIMLLIIIGLGVISFHALEAGWAAKAERATAEKRLRELKEKKDALTSELENLRSEEGIEREARQKLNFRKPGEEIVIIRDTNTVLPESDAASSSFWKTVTQWFFGLMK